MTGRSSRQPETGPKKMATPRGSLDLGGVFLRTYGRWAEDELIRLTHAGVSVSTDMHHKENKILLPQYLGNRYMLIYH